MRELLAVNQVVSKKDFFAQLDIVSFEGRHAANRLLKRLGILIFTSVTSGYKMPMQMHTVSAEGITQFQIIHFENSMMIFAAQKNIVDLRVLQGEISAEQREAALRLIELRNDPSLIDSKVVANRAQSGGPQQGQIQKHSAKA